MEVSELKVLLIEDNPGDAFLIKFYLEEFNAIKYDLRHVEMLEKGFELLEKEKFDIILLDLGLPDSNGIETIKELLHRFPGNLVIVMTGLNDEELGLETVKLGAQDFLVKARFDGKVLNSALRYAFERFQLNRKLKTYTKELDYNKARFDNIQEATGMGYFEYEPAVNTIFLSEKFHALFKLENQNKKIELSDITALVEEHAMFSQMIGQVLKEKLPVSGQFTLAGKNKKAKIYLKSVNGNSGLSDPLLVGVIQITA